jgi:hypothetical protein
MATELCCNLVNDNFVDDQLLYGQEHRRRQSRGPELLRRLVVDDNEGELLNKILWLVEGHLIASMDRAVVISKYRDLNGELP